MLTAVPLIFLQEGHLQNGDHLLQVGEVRLWGMGAEQVQSNQFIQRNP